MSLSRVTAGKRVKQGKKDLRDFPFISIPNCRCRVLLFIPRRWTKQDVFSARNVCATLAEWPSSIRMQRLTRVHTWFFAKEPFDVGAIQRNACVIEFRPNSLPNLRSNDDILLIITSIFLNINLPLCVYLCAYVYVLYMCVLGSLPYFTLVLWIAFCFVCASFSRLLYR